MSNTSVLLIEDDVIVQQVHKAMLLKLGCQVDIADSGKTALAMAKSNPTYRLIFVDIGLPDMSGFDVINHLRAQNENINDHTTIVVITGYCGNNEKQACIDAGVNDVLNKPVVINTMREILDKYHLDHPSVRQG